MKYTIIKIAILSTVLLQGMSDTLYAHANFFHTLRTRGLAHFTMNIEKNGAEINFVAPSLDILGFEDPELSSTPSNQKKIQTLQTLVANDSNKLIVFKKSRQCKIDGYILGTFVGYDIDRSNDDQLSEEQKKEILSRPKSDVHLRFVVKCKKSIKRKPMYLGFMEAFPKLKEISVYIYSGRNSMGLTITNNKTPIRPQ